MGTGETIGRSVDKIIGLCVSGVVTLALAAVTLKMVSYHNDLYDEAEEDGEEKVRAERWSEATAIYIPVL